MNIILILLTIYPIISVREAVTINTPSTLIIGTWCNRNQSNILGYVTVINYSYPGVQTPSGLVDDVDNVVSRALVCVSSYFSYCYTPSTRSN